MRAFITAIYIQLFAWIAFAAHSQNYAVLVAAAAKKGATVEVGKSYLLIEKVGFHWKIIVGTVTENGEDRDFPATMTQLVKQADLSGPSLEDYCTLVGNECYTAPKEAYMCKPGDIEGRTYKFSGEADPEFADPERFLAYGNMLVKRGGNYNVIWHNCQTFARKMANVARKD